MATPCFYHADLTESDEVVQLTSNEASHAARSRRLGVGQQVRLINGKGLVADGHIESVSNREMLIAVDTVEFRASAPLKLTIATAVPKGDRQRALVDMLTQLGVSEIVPLECEHSVTRYKPSMHDKWQRWAIEACKQAQNPWLPSIDEGIRLVDLLKVAPHRIVYADAEGELVAKLVSDVNEPIVLIGPEGGFSPAEIALFDLHKIKSVRLSGHILRTETAAISVAAQWLAQ